ncbi:Hypothetical predicted protein [Octopus vulgaris]|uniref:Uncharacterized protein n=1 Tax=Octopus vulgaris TaxID=6645 RepID=A0AA36FAI8_OCTVU|nr:Hypothetical predicted protein [Octopus vulgaris]
MNIQIKFQSYEEMLLSIERMYIMEYSPVARKISKERSENTAIALENTQHLMTAYPENNKQPYLSPTSRYPI